MYKHLRIDHALSYYFQYLRVRPIFTCTSIRYYVGTNLYALHRIRYAPSLDLACCAPLLLVTNIYIRNSSNVCCMHDVCTMSAQHRRYVPATTY